MNRHDFIRQPYLFAGMALDDPALGYRGRQVLAYVTRFVEQHGSAPGYTRIMRDLDFADRADVCRVVRRLCNKGLLRLVEDGRNPRIRIGTPIMEAVGNG